MNFKNTPLTKASLSEANYQTNIIGTNIFIINKAGFNASINISEAISNPSDENIMLSPELMKRLTMCEKPAQVIIDEKKITVKEGKSKSSLCKLQAQQPLEIELSPNNSDTIVVSISEFVDACKTVMFANSAHSPQTNYFSLIVNNNSLDISCCNGFQLACFSIPCTASNTEEEFSIEGTALIKLLPILNAECDNNANSNLTIYLTKGKSKIVLATENIIAEINYINTVKMKLANIMTYGNREYIEINKNELSNAIKRILPFTDKIQSYITLTLCNGDMMLNNNTSISQNQETITYTGKSSFEDTIRINIKLMQDFATCIKQDTMKISIANSISPIYICSENNKFKGVLMPVRKK